MESLELLHEWVTTQTKLFSETCKDAEFDTTQIKFKRCAKFLVMLYIPKNTKTNELRINVRDKRFAKFRAEKAWCVSIYDCFQPKKIVKECTNNFWNISIVYYRVGCFTEPNQYDSNKDKICSSGIHYFNHWLAAYYYSSHNWCCDAFQIEFKDNGKIARIQYPYHRPNDPMHAKLISLNALEERFGIPNIPL